MSHPSGSVGTLPSLIPHTFRTALGALAAEQDAIRLDHVGHHHRRRRRDRHDGNRRRFEGRDAENHRQHGGQHRSWSQSGAAASGGVSFGSGSGADAHAGDAEEIARQCPAVAEVAPTVRVRAQVIYGNRNWVPRDIFGTTPSYLAVRDWDELDEGDMFTDRDVRNGNKVCVIGQTLARELFQGESPIGKEIRIQNVSFRVIGVLSRKGANMMGMDQDDIVLAPWTTIKYRVSGTHASTNPTGSGISADHDSRSTR